MNSNNNRSLFFPHAVIAVIFLSGIALALNVGDSVDLLVPDISL